MMLKTIALNCAGCGSNLEIRPEMSTFACGYCGVSQVVERTGGTVSLHLIGDAIKSVQVGTDKTAAELALKRLAGELQNAENEHSAVRRQRTNELESNSKLFGGVWLGGIVICLFIAASGGVAVYIAIFLGIAGTIGILYLLSRQSSSITAKFKGTEQEIFKRGDDIRRKIAENRKLVD